MDKTVGCLYPLSSAQHAVWLDQRLAPDLPCYNIGIVVEVRGALDLDRFEAAIADTVESHDALRIVLEEQDGECVQRFPDHREVRLQRFDFSGEDDAEALAWSHIDQTLSTPFGAEDGQLWWMSWFQVEPGRGYWLLCFHHLVADGFSVSLVGNAVVRAYNKRMRNATDSAGFEEVCSYREFLAHDAEYVGSKRFLKDRNFWFERFAAQPEPVFDAPRAASIGSRRKCGQIVWQMDRAVYARIETMSAEQGVSSTHFLLALLAVHFSRWCGWRSEVVIGMPVHNRTGAVQRRTVGMFSGMIPVGISVEPMHSFLHIIRGVAAEVKRCYRHQRFPLTEIQRHLLTGVSTRSGMFDVSLSMEEFAGDLAFAGDVITTSHPLHNGYERQPLGIYVRNYESAKPVHIEFNFDPDVLDADAANTHVRLIQHLTRAVMAAPQTALSELPWMDETQQALITTTFNATDAALSGSSLVHRLVEAQAASTPDAIAVEFMGERLTYRDLNAQANRLAHHLVDLGVAPDARVAICLERGLDLVVAVLATLKAGGAYVPLDPALPDERLMHMLRDSAPRVLLTQRRLCDRLDAGAAVCVMLDDAQVGDALWAQASSEDLSCEDPAPSSLAYVIYTSGSTGQPKGVCMPHGALANLLQWQQGALPGAARTLQFAALGFDVAFQEIFSTLSSGGTLVMLEEGLRQDLPALADWLCGQDIERLFLPYIALDSLAELWSGRDASLPALRDLITAGEQLRVTPAIRRLFARCADARLHNHYGPTESHVVTAHVLAGTPEDWEALPPIGKPIANSRIYLLDAHGHPVPLGVSGEVYIGGAQVARGYLAQPALTEERFLPDPFVEGGRMYRTGDLGRWRDDGTIEYLGRNDFQVKLRGFRIELGEIEAQLSTLAGIRQCAVVVREDVPGDKRLVAYVVMDAGAEADAARLRESLGEVLPDYMVPSAYVSLDELPQTANGKLDRRSLPVPDGQALAHRAYEATVGEIESTLAQIWSELLGVERVGRHDNFFELGGHSLLAVRLVSQLRERLGIELPLSVLFTHPQLADLALDVAEAGQHTLSAITRADRSAPLPLSLAQHRLWFISRVDARASEAYHIPEAVRLRGVLDTRALQAALDRIVERHEVLRTRFVGMGGQIRQVIDAPRPFALVHQDIDGAEEATIARIGREEADTPFDLMLGPLIRGRLLRVADDDHVLLVTTHHIISDGWSAGILAQEFSVLYAAMRDGKPDPLPPLPIQYADFGVWQRQWLQGPVLQQQLRQWVEQLRGAPPLLGLPTDRPRPQIQDYSGANIDIDIDRDLAHALKDLSQRHGTTLYMTLAAAWAAVLGRLSGQEQIVIGSSHAGRSRVEIEPLIGFFINTQALKIDLSGRPTVRALLAHAKQMAVQAQSLQDVPFERLVEALNPPRSLAHHPVFQVMLSWHNTPKAQIELPGLVAEAIGGAPDTAQFDLSLELREIDDRIGGQLNYATALFDESTIRRHWHYLHAMLRAMVDDDSLTVDHIDLLRQDERALVLEGFNEALRPQASDALIHALFEARAAERPETLAIHFEGESLDYRELNERANQLAHHLRSLGVGPDQRVALCMERSVDMVVAMLATLKAGGAYVPLDPVYPDERLAYMLQDSGPVAVLTQAALRARLALPAHAVALVMDEMPRDRSAWATRPKSDPDPAAVGLTPSHMAYVIYTSGSTGTPKGVMVEHRNAMTFLQGLEACIHGVGGECSNIAWNSSFGFDMSVKAWGQLAFGRSVYLVPEDTRLNAEALLDFLERHRIQAIEGTPSHLRMLREAGLLGGRAPDLRKFLLGGEAIDAATWRELAAIDRILFFNMYGPTECSVDASCGLIDGAVPNIGRVMPGARIYLLDETRRPVPIGVAGEIHIGGDGVARGYLDRDTLTAERFVDDPFAGTSGARMYRTGDVGRWRDDGSIEYLGRNDFQVKLRGFRIELGEIEACLLRLPGVREAVVIAREDAPGDKRLVAYLTAPQGGTVPEPAQLRASLAGALPDYMLPSAFVAMDALPLTANGKVDRRMLPAPEGDSLAHGVYVAPKGEVEEMIAELWCELLSIERVGRHDNFFDLGGYSLMVFQVIEGLKQRGFNAALQDVLLAQELSALAQLLIANNGSHRASNQWVTIRHGGKRPPLIFIHEPSGEVLSYERLARHLDAEVGLYGIRADRQSVGRDSTTEQLAQRYAEIILAELPSGPYRLAGWSAGGVLAYEVARSLAAQGQRVEFVGLIDSWHRGKADAERVEMTLGDRKMLLISYIEYQGYRLADDELAQLHGTADLSQAIDLAKRNRWIRKDLSAGEFEARMALAYDLRTAAHTYRAEPIEPPVHLFTAHADEAMDPSNGWGAVLGDRLRVHPIGGDHWSLMMDPDCAGRLGVAMSMELSRLDGARAPTEPGSHPSALIIRSGTSGRDKVFCIPGAGANAASFLDLCAGFPAGPTIIGIEAPGLLGDTTTVTVEDAARSYVDVIRAMSPDGPYHLIGHSFGGWIAMEAARQLIDASASVAPVMLVDTQHPRERVVADRAEALREYAKLLELTAGTRFDIGEDPFDGSDEPALMRILFEKMKQTRLWPGNARLSDLESSIDLFCRQYAMPYRHETPFGGRGVLFRAASMDAPEDGVDVAAWRRFEPELTVVQVEKCDHLSILTKPSVDRLCEEIHKHWFFHGGRSS